MTSGKQSGEGFGGEEDPEVGDEQVEQGEGKPAHLEMVVVLVVVVLVVMKMIMMMMKRQSVRLGIHL